jgi:hypothetical protein
LHDFFTLRGSQVTGRQTLKASRFSPFTFYLNGF